MLAQFQTTAQPENTMPTDAAAGTDEKVAPTSKDGDRFSEDGDNQTALDTSSTFSRPAPDVFQLLKSYRSYQGGKAVQTYGLPIIVPVGLVGNTLSLVIMLRRKNRRIPCCTFMAALAVSDNTVMLCATYWWLQTEILPDLRPLADHLDLAKFECKVFTYVYTVCSFASMCLVLAMTFNRFLAVTNPLKVKIFGTVRRTKMTICGITLFSVCYAVPMGLVYSDILENGLCVRLVLNTTVSIIWSWIHICLASLVPFTLLLVMNSSIIITIRRRGKFLAASTGGKETDQRDDKSVKSQSYQENQLTMMLLVVAFALLILSVPDCSIYILLKLYDVNYSLERLSNVYLFGHLADKLYIANSALNFFFYCIGGSKFRKDFLEIFQTCCPCLKKAPQKASHLIRSANQVRDDRVHEH